MIQKPRSAFISERRGTAPQRYIRPTKFVRSISLSKAPPFRHSRDLNFSLVFQFLFIYLLVFLTWSLCGPLTLLLLPPSWYCSFFPTHLLLRVRQIPPHYAELSSFVSFSKTDCLSAIVFTDEFVRKEANPKTELSVLARQRLVMPPPHSQATIHQKRSICTHTQHDSCIPPNCRALAERLRYARPT
ncbi:hypothetical protein BJ322DRAFT_684084 [Thelephora terrestris]|uniref:Uncharacterized protein n=1 Tax=Thelephora terrestris TaxID=56493 RepID=A0A9P6L7P1_9AGAM|nr:hypothetical protein BJ322DRAFT_684084 [Thelephora terrestris]